MKPNVLLAPVATILLSATQGAARMKRADTCNGHAELCSKSYGEVSFVGAHNSYAVGVNNMAANQDYDVDQQLKDGIRLLQMQAHNKDGTIQLCHTSCSLLDGGSLADYLGKVNTFMTQNPSEVVTLVIVNIDNLPVSQFADNFKSAGLDSLAYSPGGPTIAQADWPTLGAMVDANTRLVTFIDNQADFESVPYIMDEFTNVWESAFGVTGTFDCEVNRTKGDTSTQLYMINHFLDKPGILGSVVPDIANANTTNAAQGDNSLGAHVEMCTSQYSRAPNFLLVDYYEFGGGSVFEVAATINGVTYDNSDIATPKPTSSGGSNSGNGSGGDDAAMSLLSGGGILGAVSGILSSIAFGAFMVL